MKVKSCLRRVVWNSANVPLTKTTVRLGPLVAFMLVWVKFAKSLNEHERNLYLIGEKTSRECCTSKKKRRITRPRIESLRRQSIEGSL